MTTAADVLDQFDHCADHADFPDLDNGYYYPVDARTHLYGDGERWAMVVELLGYTPRGGNLIDVVYRYGNCLDGEPGTMDLLARVDNMARLRSGGAPAVVRGRALPVQAPAGTPLHQVFRQLAVAHRELLLADETELRAGLPADLPLVLRVEEWHQPVAFWDTRPSEHEAFRQFADVLAAADPARYRPTLPPTTHWSHWPTAGTL